MREKTLLAEKREGERRKKGKERNRRHWKEMKRRQWGNRERMDGKDRRREGRPGEEGREETEAES